MNLKRRVRIDHCYKSKETRWKHALASIAIKVRKQDGKHVLATIG